MQAWLLAAAALACAALPPAAGADGADAVPRAGALLRAGRAAEAFALLAPLETARAGETAFDYALALAALDSGRAEFASVVLERVLAVDADFAGARVDLGRAYFLMGDHSGAKAVFERALARNPPPAARATIAYYLAEIGRRSVPHATATGYVELGLGRDTDINNATAQAQIPVPALGNLVFSLNPSNVKTADSFAEAAAGGALAVPLGEEWSAYAGIDARYRGNERVAAFNFGSADLRAGFSRTGEDIACRFGLNGGEYDLGRARNRVYAGIDGELRLRTDGANLLSLFGQHARQRFPSPALSANAFDQTTVGLGWVHLFGGGSLTSVGPFVGSEHATDGRADGDKRLRGLRLGGQTALAENALLFANLGWQRGDYSRVNPAFLLTRRDTLADVTVGVSRNLSADWSLRGQVTRILNGSNLPIYQYDRYIGTIALRHEFR